MQRNEVRTNGPRPLTRRVLLIALTAASLTSLCVFLPALSDMPALDVPALLDPGLSTEQFRSRAARETERLDDWERRWDHAGRDLDLRLPSLPADMRDERAETRARFTSDTVERVRLYRNRLALFGILPVLWLLLLCLARRFPRAAPYCALVACLSMLCEPVLNGDQSLWFTPYHLVTTLLLTVLVLVEWRGRERPPLPPPPPPPLWQQLREAGFMYLLGEGAPVTRRIEPPGLLSALSLTGVTQKFWTYRHRNLILFGEGAAEYLYVPASGTGERAHQRSGTTTVLTSLPVRAREADPVRRSQEDRYAGCFALVENAETFAALPAGLAAKLDRFGPEIDLAPRLHDDLLRIVTRGELRDVLSLLALLDTVTTFRGHGDDEFDPAQILRGEEALDVLSAKLPSVPDKVRHALQQQVPGTESARRLQRASAVVRQTTDFEGKSGGLRTVLAFVQLRVLADGWRYKRTVLWSHFEERMQLT